MCKQLRHVDLNYRNWHSLTLAGWRKRLGPGPRPAFPGEPFCPAFRWLPCALRLVSEEFSDGRAGAAHPHGGLCWLEQEAGLRILIWPQISDAGVSALCLSFLTDN